MLERHGHQEHGDCPQVLHPHECREEARGVLGADEGLTLLIVEDNDRIMIMGVSALDRLQVRGD